MQSRRIGVLALQGDVSEHVKATREALKRLKLAGEVVEVRDEETIKNIDGLIIPGGESTVLHTLTERASIFENIKKIKNIFGTCAGTIFLAKDILHSAPNQKTLGLMHIVVDRNAYGAQTDSFETKLKTNLGSIDAIFIRAPRIHKIGSTVNIIAKNNTDIVAVEERAENHFYLATTFHPELTTTLFHEYFLNHIFK